MFAHSHLHIEFKDKKERDSNFKELKDKYTSNDFFCFYKRNDNIICVDFNWEIVGEDFENVIEEFADYVKKNFGKEVSGYIYANDDGNMRGEIHNGKLEWQDVDWLLCNYTNEQIKALEEYAQKHFN